MKKRIILSMVAVATILSGGAQVNQQDARGYLDRAELMLRDHNYNGCIDQLNQAQWLSLSADGVERADFMRAMVAAAMGENNAMELLDGFVSKYPNSSEVLVARMMSAQLLYEEGEYADALGVYAQIQPKSLDREMQADFREKRGFCFLKIGEFDRAAAEFDELGKFSNHIGTANFYKGYIAYAQDDIEKAESLFKQVNSSEAPGNMADYYLAQIYFLREDYDKALSTSRRLLKHADDVAPEYTAEANRIAGESLFNLGQEDEAVTYINRYLDFTDEGLPSAYYIVGLNSYNQGDYPQAIEYMTKATEQKNEMGQSAYLAIGQSYLKEGNADAAALAFNKAIQLDFDKDISELAYYNYVVAKTHGGKVPFGDYVSTFESFIQRYPESKYAPRVQEYIVTGFLADNDYESALSSINRFPEPSEATLKAKQQILYTLGCRDVAAGRVGDALTRLNAAKELGNINPDIVNECDLWIAEAYYGKGKYADAASAYQTYLSSVGNSSENRGLALYSLAYARFSEREYESALTDFSNYVESPGNTSTLMVADARNRMGDCCYYGSDFSGAAIHYDKAFELAPNNGDYALYQKAVMKGLLGEHKEKIDGMNQLFEQFPSSGLIPSALLEQAESYNALGQKAKVVDTYERLMDSYPTTELGRQGALLLAVTHIGQGNQDAGIATYKKVISAYPTSEEAEVAAEDLKRIYADMGALDEYVAFIDSVPNAPRLEVGEVETLTFQSAEKDYTDNGSIERIEKYVSDYPNGKNVTIALEYLVAYYNKEGNDDKVLTYSTRLVEEYPDSRCSENVMALKGDIEYRQGKGEMAFDTYSALEKRASSPETINIARMGVMRTSFDLEKYDLVLDKSNLLLTTSGISEDDKNEAMFMRGYANMKLGNAENAITDWQTLATDTESLSGAKSAYHLGQLYFDQDDLAKSKEVVLTFVGSNTPHHYWLARGFILLSDIYNKEGNEFEAKEYLKTLQQNYSGAEPDIVEMINSRLN